tara:strand:+ start:880 stop:3852 length:2973 start_codon:yes stop_codon:yes gene_type:complete
MANITQTIPALTAGISQQPDEQKIPGQVKNMVNALPDVTQGLLKRPGGKFVASLSDGTNNSTADGKWFHYYRDENEQYIGQVARNGAIKMWDCLTGAEKTVVNGIGNNTYLTHTGDEDIQTLTLNDFTYINNRSIPTEMDTTTEPLGDFQKEIFVELKTISYSKQYSLNVFDNTTTSTVTTATRINVALVNSSNNYCDSAFHMRTHANRGNSPFARCGTQAGDGRDAFAPNVGTRIFSVDSNKTLTDEGATGGTLANGTLSDTSYSYQVNIFNSSNQGSQTGRKNLYFRIATTGQSVPYTEGSGSTQTTTYQARYTTTYDLLHGGEGWEQGDYFYVFMKDGYYKITIDEISTSVIQANLSLVRPQPTPFDTETTITAESILGDIRTELIASGNFTASDITQIGTGLHIKRSSIFNASTPVGQLLNVVASKVNDVGDLPTQCKHGMVVEVVNSTAEEDNYYVKFFGNNDKDGEGTWEECAKPGRKIRLKRSTMPVLLIRTADSNFRLTELDGSTYTISGVQYSVPQWDDALVGDDVTNPEPSFIGKNINKMLFFRNRFSILADENIVMSRPGDFTNFFAKSAIQLIDSDPIDIAASSEYPAIIFDGIQVNTGLVLFSKNQQFMLTTDSDVFSPRTAKINALSTYNFNFATNPISLGTTIGFLDNAGKFSRFFEMAQVQREGEPQVIEQSAVVSRLFEKDLKLISNSRENSVIFFSEEGTSTLYGYRYFDQITERKLASWFKWTLTGTIQYHCMQDDNLFVVVRNNNKDQLLKYAIKMDSNTHALAENRVHLDHLMSLSISSSASYNRDTDRTSFSKPTGLESSNQLAVYSVVDTGPNTLGRYNKAYFVGNNIEVDGDWRGTNFILGYLFTMEVEIPTIYYLTQAGENWRADTRANTVLHRVKFGFGPIGLYETTLKRTGRVDYTEVFELTDADGYQATTSPINDDNNLRTVPIYDRNINANLTIKSTHPAPATIHNMTWEGVYTTNNYKRV